MIIPPNKIQKNKYTSGGEFVYKDTNASYQGYYYIINNTFFEGKDYNPTAKELIKTSEANKLLSKNVSTANYSLISGVTSQILQTPKISHVAFSNNSSNVRYFYKKTTDVSPIIIREINEDSYLKIKSNPLFQTTYIGNNKTLDQADKELPGLKLFLRG
jgi:hypothetical protein